MSASVRITSPACMGSGRSRGTTFISSAKFDHIGESYGAIVAQVHDFVAGPPLTHMIECREKPGDGIVHVRVITTGGSTAEHRNRRALLEQSGELMDSTIRALSRTENGKEAKACDGQARSSCT